MAKIPGVSKIDTQPMGQTQGSVGRSPAKSNVDNNPGTQGNHTFLGPQDYATQDIEASTPQINPDATIPFIMGRTRITQPQVIWYGNYRTIYEETTQENTETNTIQTELGYNEFENREVTTNNTTTSLTPVDYNETIVLGLCMGPNVKLKAIYSDNELIWSGETGTGKTIITDIDGPFAEAYFHSGQNTANTDDYLAGLVGDDIPAFVGVSYIVIPTIASKDYEGLSLTFEVERSDFPRGLPGITDPTNADGDINAASMIWELIRSDQGAMGIPLFYLDPDSFLDFYNECETRGYYFSLVDATDDYGANFIDTLQTLLGAIMYVDPADELVKIREYYFSQFDPSTARAFDASNIVDIQEAPRNSWSSLPTHYELKWSDRSQNYRETTMRVMSRSISTDDKRVDMRLLSSSCVIACTQDVAQRILTRLVMHNGVPTQEINMITNSDAEGLVPGDAFIVSWPEWGFVEIPFFVRSVTEQDDELGTYLVNGTYFIRPNSEDFKLHDSDTEWVAPINRPVTPTVYEFVGEGLIPNYIHRLGVNTPINVITRYGGYALLLVRAENEGQVAVNVYNRQNAVVRKNVLYAGSAYLDAQMNVMFAATEGLIKELTFHDASALSLIAGARYGYCGGEWFSYESASFSGTNVTLHNVNRGLWGSQMRHHAVNALFWFIDDNKSRLFGTEKLGKELHYKLVSSAFGGVGKIADALSIVGIVPEFGNYDMMNNPSKFTLDGKRFYPGVDVPTLYRNVEYVFGWNNRDRTTTLPVVVTADSDAPEVIVNAEDCYYMDGRDSGDDLIYMGLGIDGLFFEPALEFDFSHVKLKFTSDQALGAATLSLTHRMYGKKSGQIYPIEIPILIAAKPGLIVDFNYNWRIKFATEFVFDYVTNDH